MNNYKEKNERLAMDLIAFLNKNNYYQDTRIYFNGKAIENGNKIIENIQPSDYFEYANNETLSMSFEGALYHLLNYQGSFNPFEQIFENHGCYYQLGNAWNLTVYYNEEEK